MKQAVAVPWLLNRSRSPTADVSDPIRPLFQSKLVRVGSFRCPISHPHFHDSGPIRSHLFVFPRTSVWIEHEGGVPFVGDPTQAALYNPGQVYWRRPISPEGDRSDWFGVAPDLLREIAAPFDPAMAGDELVRFRHEQAPAKASTYRAQRVVFDYVRTSHEPDVLAVEERVVDILSQLFTASHGRRSMSARGALKRHAAIAEDARAYLARHYARRESLSDIAHAIGCSVFHLCRLFRKHTGQSLHAYRHELRVRHALELVTSGPRDLLAVALALGYSGHSHFTAAFRAAFGVPPSAVRTETLARAIAGMSRPSGGCESPRHRT
jgi:AraC-like DNA-binding protein